MRITLSALALLMSASLAGAQTAPPTAPPAVAASNVASSNAASANAANVPAQPAAAAATPARLTPTSTDIPDAALEIRAAQAFNKGDYSQALPMLQKLVKDLKPDAAQADKVAMIQEQIRVCEKSKSAVTSVGSSASSAAAAAKETTRTPHEKPKDGEVLDISIKDLGNFDFDSSDPTASIPADVKALDGVTVRLHGYMIALDAAENISKFALVPSLFNCCYGQPPQVQHTIVVNCPKGKAVSFYPDEIIVQGKLKVEIAKDGGYIVSIFSVETTSVKPAPK